MGLACTAPHSTAATRSSAPRDAYQLRGVEVGGTSRLVAHDVEGRVTQDGARGYRYGPLGELAEVEVQGAAVEAYALDGLGRLAGVFAHGALTTAFTSDGAQLVEGLSSTGALQWEAAWGPGLDELLEWDDVAGGTGRHLALRGSRADVTAFWSVSVNALSHTAEYSPEGLLTRRDADGVVVCTEETGASCTLPAGSPFGFSGAWRSDVTGLVAMRARWYSPALGEFLSQDPAGYVDSFNLYGFAGFDPINRWDPWGLESSFTSQSGGVGPARGPLPLAMGTQMLLAAGPPPRRPPAVRPPNRRQSTSGSAGSTPRATRRRGPPDAPYYEPILDATLTPPVRPPPRPVRIERLDGPFERQMAEFQRTMLEAAHNSAAQTTSAAGGASQVAGQGFRSFSAFKQAMGRAGPGQAWHHIVEQTPGNIARFGPEAIHNTANLVRLPLGAGSIHARVSGLYSSIRPDITGSTSVTVRQWLGTQSFEAQSAFGQRALQNITSGVWP